MLVYRDAAVHRPPRDAVADCHQHLTTLARATTPNHDDLVDALIEAGRLESALADARCPVIDEREPRLVVARELSAQLGAAVWASWHGRPCEAYIGLAHRALGHLDLHDLPPTLRLTVPEGYAYYALYPEAYGDAVHAWASRARPPRVLCLGVRSIGTSLSAMARAALVDLGIPVETWTIRPHGHPFEREVRMARSLVSPLERHEATCLLVDEGPGLSGSSLAGAAEALAALGVPDDRIVFVAAWQPDPTHLRSSRARDRWRRHAVIVGALAHVRPSLAREGVVAADALDISGGTWRRLLPTDVRWPAANPQHERLKYLEDGRVTRFAGLGGFGEARRVRAARLGDAGWTTGVDTFRRGLLTSAWVPARPLDSSGLDQMFLAHALEYIAWLRREMPTGARADAGPLGAMLRTNVAEGLGDDWVAAADRLSAASRGWDEPAIAHDGRLVLHEWLRTSDGWLKADALDHHDDHFLPGPADGAWDLAGLLVETAIGGTTADDLVRRYGALTGDGTIAHRLPFHRAAYAAFRLGLCTLSAESVRADEARRFTRAAGRYRDALRAALAAASEA